MRAKNEVSPVRSQEKTAVQSEHHDKLKAHKIGDIALTVTTFILVGISVYFDANFFPFIILLMSSRIAASVYTVIRTASKRETAKLTVWVTLCSRSVYSCLPFVG